MPKQSSKARQDQDSAMDVYSCRLTAWHARKARRVGGGNLAEGIRKLIEDFKESSIIKTNLMIT